LTVRHGRRLPCRRPDSTGPKGGPRRPTTRPLLCRRVVITHSPLRRYPDARRIQCRCGVHLSFHMST